MRRSMGDFLLNHREMHRIAAAATAIVISLSPVLGALHPALAAPATSSRIAQAHVPVMDAASELNAAPATGAQLAAARSAPLNVVPLAAAGSHPQREVFGFVNAFNLGSPTLGYPHWDFTLLPTLPFLHLPLNTRHRHPFTNGH